MFPGEAQEPGKHLPVRHTALACLSACVSFQRTDPDPVSSVSPAVMVRSSSQDSEVSTVVGEHHTALLGAVQRGLLPPGGCA